MDFNSWLNADLPADDSEDESDVDFVPKEVVDSDAASYGEDESGNDTEPDLSPIEIDETSQKSKPRRKSSGTKPKRGTHTATKRKNAFPVSDKKEPRLKRKRDVQEEDESRIAFAKEPQRPSPKKVSINVESFPRSLLQPGRLLHKAKLPIPLYSNDLEKIIEDRKNYYTSLCEHREFLANTKIPDLIRTERETKNELKLKKSALAEQLSRNVKLIAQIDQIMTGVGVVAMNLTQRADTSWITPLPTPDGGQTGTSTKGKQSKRKSSKENVPQQGKEWERQDNVEWFLENLSNRVRSNTFDE